MGRSKLPQVSNLSLAALNRTHVGKLGSVIPLLNRSKSYNKRESYLPISLLIA